MRVSIATLTILSFAHTLSAAPAVIEARATRNDLASGACKPYTLIFARGTLEPAGNLGSIGTPLVEALARVLPGGAGALAVQGVNYDADMQGAIRGGDPAGSRAMAALVNRACAKTKIILGGYSQGAQLVHNAVALLSAAEAKKIDAVVMFGDPKNGKALGKGVGPRSRTFCNAADVICKGRFQITAAHKTYANDCPKAASFIRSIVV
ncbi:hypothetical protein H072_11321 [Dactylellina haptotyla CBS 200.50]|uniref:cutinase n=1 Tax=Dactylellina haptotyla (strain CBS 200.50) TaxID=1284197 RepID=S8A2H8_DACHA|nr:hypothetical protein H072_11321 [Dactylellina haptotyla CBS 200.50]